MPEFYDVFLSYRRDGGSHLARFVHKLLTERGYKTFLDVDEMPAGPFPDSLARAIGSTYDFVPLLTPGCLEPHGQKADWFREEIWHAFSKGRNIIPLRTQDFTHPDPGTMTDMIDHLMHLNHLTYYHESPEASIEALCRAFLSDERSLQEKIVGKWEFKDDDGRVVMEFNSNGTSSYHGETTGLMGLLLNWSQNIIGEVHGTWSVKEGSLSVKLEGMGSPFWTSLIKTAGVVLNDPIDKEVSGIKITKVTRHALSFEGGKSFVRLG